MDSSSSATFKEQTEEEKIREYYNKIKEIQLIEEKYFEKQGEKEFIYGTKNNLTGD